VHGKGNIALILKPSALKCVTHGICNGLCSSVLGLYMIFQYLLTCHSLFGINCIITVFGTKAFINCKIVQIIRKATMYVAFHTDIYVFFIAHALLVKWPATQFE
jgi:hypothetical protein